MYRVGIKGSLPVRHYLRGDFGPESAPHGHEYVIEWSFTVSELDQRGFAVDIAAMEKARDLVVGRCAGMTLNDHPFFSERQTSIENAARFLLNELDAELDRLGFDRRRVTAAELAVWESPTAWASWRESYGG